MSSLSALLRAVGLAAVLAVSAPLLTGCQGAAKEQSPKVAFERLTVETASGPVAFQVEIADDEAERQQGLMYRESLAPDRGMLFDFKSVEMRSFWMKNTLIPLDIIFIGADGRIINIASMTTPHSEAQIPSFGPALGVLEIAGGRAGELGIKPGDRVRHRIFPAN